MIEFTEEAKKRLELYLQRMRSALRGTRAIEPGEVEQNVREHVALALASVEGPVGADRLAGVLEQLGPPERWLPEDDRPWLTRAWDGLIKGPEDWRLAYVSFALTLAMIVLLPAGGVGVLLLLPAFIVSRAWVSLMEQRNEPLDARRWFVLPPIVLMFLLFVGGVMGSVIGMAAVLAAENDLTRYGIPHPGHRAEQVVAFAGYLGLVAGGWWIVLSGLFAVFFEPIRALFAPLLARLKRRHLLVLTALGAVVLGIGAWLTEIS
jgi:hypothetical protein